jgi:glycosyltransferase involved in cell wall biosynthesis
VPLVSVLLAVHDDARFLGEAIDSMLRQTVGDLELIVVDDASTDDTPSILSALEDRRLIVLKNVEQLGLAASLNRGLGEARGRYIARLDADDVAFASRLELQLERIRAEPRLAVLGSGIVDLDDEGRLGHTHRLPQGATAVRWHALFSSPFFHPTVLVDREVLEDHGLRYDPSYAESEDYDLWTRLFAFADGGNLPDPLVLKRVHSGQASQRRGDLQTSFQRQVALREIARTTPDLSAEDADLAWGLGSGRGVQREAADRAGAALLDLLAAFERRHGIDADVREAAARALSRAKLLGPMRKLAPWLPAQVVVERVRRPFSDRRIRKRVAIAVPRKSGVLRVTVVSPEPTPYRSPLFDRVASKDEIDLTVIYAALTVADRPWAVEPRHRSVFLRGLSVPGARRLIRHDYPVTPGVARALRQSNPDVVVVSGWSTFASQAAIAWCRAHRIPYVLHVESHDLDPRSRWRRAVKGAVAPRVVRAAASVLVVGTAARESVITRGARPERVRVFANTVDVPVWLERADRLAAERTEGRALQGLTDDDVVVQCVARLVPEKGLDTLVRAVGEAGDERFHLVLVGDGPEREGLIELAGKLDVRLLVHGDMPEEALAEQYVEADVFALLSRHEPWGVVVNEAAASGLPLVLSDCVGAARDLLRDGENGFVVPADDVGAAAAALRRLAADPGLRRELGARSRELVRGWGYEPSAESFVAAVREATAR